MLLTLFLLGESISCGSIGTTSYPYWDFTYLLMQLLTMLLINLSLWSLVILRDGYSSQGMLLKWSYTMLESVALLFLRCAGRWNLVCSPVSVHHPIPDYRNCACICLAMPTADLSWSGLWSHVIWGLILSACNFFINLWWCLKKMLWICHLARLIVAIK